MHDVIIFSNTFEDHIKHIREVFDVLKYANLKFKQKKCQFIKTSMEYLGHIISPDAADGIATDSTKIEKIFNYKRPINVDEVRSF